MSMSLYPPERPQTIGEVLDTTFKFLGVSLLKMLPYGMLITLAGQLGNIHNLATGRRTRSVVPRDPMSWLLLGVSLIASLMLWAAMLLRQRAIARGERVSMGAELAAALRMLPGLILLTLAIVVGVCAGIVLLVVPGVYLAVGLSLAMPALVLAGKRPFDALKYSLQLVHGYWWRTLAIFLITLAIVIVFYLLGGIVMAILVRMARGADLALVWASTAVLVISLGAFSNPCFAAMLLAVFGDLEARHAASAAAP
jgi:hypothetical protein